MPLLDKGFINNPQPTKNNNGNFFFDINMDCLDYNGEDIKELSLKKAAKWQFFS